VAVTQNKSIIFFDGICNLCNASVQFIIKRDRKDSFRFVAIQSPIAQQILPDISYQRRYESVLLYENGNLYSESDAALRITRKLKGIWPILYIFTIIPHSIRNAAYRLIAKNRYRWFGKQESCMVPSNDMDQKFLT